MFYAIRGEVYMNDTWSQISKTQYVNDSELGPWGIPSGDESQLMSFLKKRFIRETRVWAEFDILVGILGIVSVFGFLISEIGICYCIGAALIAIFFLVRFNTNITYLRRMQAILDSRSYSVCNVNAFDFETESNGKYCSVKDSEGHILMVKDVTVAKDKTPVYGEPAQFQLTYQGYFTYKDDRALLLRVPSPTNIVYFFVIPEYFLRADKD